MERIIDELRAGEKSGKVTNFDRHQHLKRLHATRDNKRPPTPSHSTHSRWDEEYKK